MSTDDFLFELRLQWLTSMYLRNRISYKTYTYALMRLFNNA